MIPDPLLAQLETLVALPGALCRQSPGRNRTNRDEFEQVRGAVLGILTRTAAKDDVDARAAIHPCPWCA